MLLYLSLPHFCLQFFVDDLADCYTTLSSIPQRFGELIRRFMYI